MNKKEATAVAYFNAIKPLAEELLAATAAMKQLRYPILPDGVCRTPEDAIALTNADATYKADAANYHAQLEALREKCRTLREQLRELFYADDCIIDKFKSEAGSVVADGDGDVTTLLNTAPAAPPEVNLIFDITNRSDGAFADSAGQKGLTKREYFAAAALQGILAQRRCDSAHYETAGIDAVYWADCLIARLNENPTSLV